MICDYFLAYKNAMKSITVKQKHELKILVIITDFPNRRWYKNSDTTMKNSKFYQIKIGISCWKTFFSFFKMSLLPSSLGAKLAIAKENELEIYSIDFVNLFSIRLSEILIVTNVCKVSFKIKPLIVMFVTSLSLCENWHCYQLNIQCIL